MARSPHAFCAARSLHRQGTVPATVEEGTRRRRCFQSGLTKYKIHFFFDTGFVTFEKGWETIRDDDRGLLWEHLVLDALRFRHPDERLFYWRDKAGRELDFVVRHNRDRVDLFECKIDPDELDPAGVETFRAAYPQGENYLVAPMVKEPYRQRCGTRVFTVCTTEALP